MMVERPQAGCLQRCGKTGGRGESQMRFMTRVLLLLVLFAMLGVAVRGYRGPSAGSAGGSSQDSVFLERRISMLESRLGSIELSIRSLELQASGSQRSTPTQPGRDPETSVLRSDVETLNARMTLLECGLVQLDERTLSASAKEARKRSSQPLDGCRLHPETPIPLTPRR